MADTDIFGLLKKGTSAAQQVQKLMPKGQSQSQQGQQQERYPPQQAQSRQQSQPGGPSQCEMMRDAFRREGIAGEFNCGPETASSSKVGEPVFRTGGAPAGSSGGTKTYRVLK